MVVARSAIVAYRARVLDSSRHVKEYTEAKLCRLLRKMEPPPEWVFKPYKHQLATFLLCIKFRKYFLMLDMGLGKTKISLDVFQYRRRTEDCRRMLVLVRNTANLNAWVDEAAKHAPDLDTETLHPKLKPAQREQALFDAGDVLVATYAGFTKLMTHVVDGRKQPNVAAIKRLAKSVQFLALDESRAVANHTSQVFRVLRKFCPLVPNVYLMTGTPFNGDPQSLWAQFFLIDRGATLGPTLGIMRASLFREVETEYATDYVLRKRCESELHRICQHRSIRYAETEVEDLPPLVGGIDNLQARWVDQSREQVRYTIMLLKEMGEAREAESQVAALYYKMRCVAAGYFPSPRKPGEFIDFADNPRTQAVVDQVLECGDRQVLIYYWHHHAGVLVSKALRKAKIKHATAGQKDNIPKALDQFKSGSVRVLVASVGSVAEGLNLQFCRIVIYAESPDDIVTRRQSEKRIHRAGGIGTAYAYDVCVRGTVDEQVLEALKGNKRVLDAVVDG